MDLFTPVIDPNEFHPNFANTLQGVYRGTRAILQAWANGFVDRDGKFVAEFQRTFNSGFWELYLHAVLKERGLTIDFGVPAPDFVVVAPDSFCVEAVTAQAAQGTPNEWDIRPEDIFKGLHSLKREPLVDQATIRLSNSISAKYEKYRNQYAKLPHVQGRPFVLAIAPFEQPFFYMQLNQAILRVLFRYDGEEVDPQSGEITSKWMRSIKKPNGAEIALGSFTGADMEEISAVVFSNTATFAKLSALNTDKAFRRVFSAIRFDAKTRKLVQVAGPAVTDYKETLLDGLSVYYNPFARVPLARKVFDSPEVAHYSADLERGFVKFDVPDGALFHHMSSTIVTHSDVLKDPSLIRKGLS